MNAQLDQWIAFAVLGGVWLVVGAVGYGVIRGLLQTRGELDDASGGL